MTNQNYYPAGVEIRSTIAPEFAEIVTPDAMQFVATLIRAFAD